MNPDSPITPDDPRLTAFALGELDGAVRDAVARAVAADAALQQAVERLRADVGAIGEQLRHAEGAQLEFSTLLESQVLDRLLQEETGAADHANAAEAPAESAAAPQVAVTGRPSGAGRATVDWRQGLGRDARRRVVWWSPFALPLAACFVAVTTVGLLWWDGHQDLAQAFSGESSEAVLVSASETISGSPAVFAKSAAPLPQMAALASFDSVADARPQDALAAQEAGTGGSFGLSARQDLFAPRVWAYHSGGGAVRGASLRRDSEAGYSSADDGVLLAGQPALQTDEPASALVNDRSAAFLADGAVAVAARARVASAAVPARAPDRPVSTHLNGSVSAAVADAPATPLLTQSAASAADSASAASQVLPNADVAAAHAARDGHPVAASIAVAQVATVEPLASVQGEPSAAMPQAAPVQSEASAPSERVATRPSQVLAEAVALVRPVAGALAAVGSDASGQNTDIFSNAPARPALARSEPVRPAPVAVTAPVSGGAAEITGTTSALPVAASAGLPSAQVASASAAAVTAVATGMENDPADVAAMGLASPSTADIVTLAAARRFSRASLEELELAAFAGNGDWRPGSEEIVSAAAELAQTAAPSGDSPQAVAAVGAPAVRPQNLASRYVQLKLWIEAGQLPPQTDLDAEAIVRDAAQAYLPGAVRRMRLQSAVAAGQSDVTGEAVQAASAVPLTAQEVEALEARSLLLRLVRAYATVLKDRPADAVAQLDGIGEQLRQQPRIANSRAGQDFLKLLGETRALF